MLGRLQLWLWGWPDDKPRPWFSIQLGNLISDARYWSWRLRGGGP